MAELDTKQRVLVAIYTEYQKDLPNMGNNISAYDLGIEYDVFKVALLKLSNEGYIRGADFIRGGQGNKITSVYTREIMMTRDGIDYVEEKLGIKPDMSAGEKVKEVSKTVAAWGYNELKDFAIKVTGEIVKGAAGLNN